MDRPTRNFAYKEGKHLVIYINGRFLVQSITGVQRYAVELVKAVDRRIERGGICPVAHSFVLLVPRGTKQELGLRHIQVKQVGRLLGHAWEQLELPNYTWGHLLLNLGNTGPMLKHHQIVTIHDVAVASMPQAYSPAFRIWYRTLGFWLGKVAKVIVTVSAFSKGELSRHYRIKESKIRIVYEGSEHITGLLADESVLDKHRLRDKPFVLAVSSLHPAKNFQAIVQAVEHLKDSNFRLVVSGGINPKVFRPAGMEFPQNVRYVGYVNDRELKALYLHATCFVFPSLHEGFGLPPLEAMACGCPVIISRAASLPEVCGDAALYCDPHSPEDIAAKIRQLINDQNLQEQLRIKGLKRAKKFTWEKCAQETLGVIEEVLSQ